MPSFDQISDRPVPFGYKVSWFAMRAADPAAVLDAFGLTEATPANWTSGLASAYGYSRGSDPWLFISPPVDGWVSAVSFSLPYPTVETHHDIGRKFDALFSRLIARFDDVQFFGSYRVVGFCAWARALRGKPMRSFAYADGQVLMNFGDQTPEEAKLGLPNLTGLSPDDAANKIFSVAGEQDAEQERLIGTGLSHKEAYARVRENGHAFPDEGDVVELAALWSIDPTQLLDQDHPSALGLAARLPENLRQ